MNGDHFCIGEVLYCSRLENKGFTRDCIANCIVQIFIDNIQYNSYNISHNNYRGVTMKITITLTDQELEFLQNVQNLINSETTPKQKHCSLEDVIHECIINAISSGVDGQRGQA